MYICCPEHAVGQQLLREVATDAHSSYRVHMYTASGVVYSLWLYLRSNRIGGHTHTITHTYTNTHQTDSHMIDGQ